MLSTDFINEFSEFKHYKGCFSYKNDNIYVIHIDDNVRVKIERITFDVARIYFTDKQGQQIPAPPNTILRNLMIFRLENQKHQVVKGELELVTEVIEQ
ncbi:28445_t:CDS:2 [Gigaspora margarita]|uniref:28445_t:CDS:1 n=1 Tax=Gigaspora margarita TaxID=4874 RepID=A0ABM8W3I2_GIGMA|nr:28445_t:CDS:2 [Gigaspora margarita]